MSPATLPLRHKYRWTHHPEGLRISWAQTCCGHAAEWPKQTWSWYWRGVNCPRCLATVREHVGLMRRTR